MQCGFFFFFQITREKTFHQNLEVERKKERRERKKTQRKEGGETEKQREKGGKTRNFLVTY